MEKFDQIWSKPFKIWSNHFSDRFFLISTSKKNLIQSNQNQTMGLIKYYYFQYFFHSQRNIVRKRNIYKLTAAIIGPRLSFEKPLKEGSQKPLIEGSQKSLKQGNKSLQ